MGSIGWGVGLVVHGLNVFEVINIFGPNWEKKQIGKEARTTALGGFVPLLDAPRRSAPRSKSISDTRGPMF